MSKMNWEQPQSPSFIVKVGDLLRKQGTSDTITLTDFTVNELISHLSGKITLTSASEEEIIVITKDIQWIQHSICDYCGKEFDGTKASHDEMYSALLAKEIPEENDDLILPIQSDMSLDLYPLLYNVAMFYNDVQHICPECEKRFIQEEKKHESSQAGEEFLGSSNIVFK